ncbi:alpha/beta hydrolase fold protein [Cyanobacterium stanieri PCC 7202]|uniref:Alpha/beta hydrolase fold protein n=1 Tax=Cyanobacterium stanieri (strain ATCC 29140 / PCC 7202) TaxID=292563 RepID=K9YGS7_CYASC|nr:alpha/beta hydrolase fold protein [Cyanobacterium stanieri PCC 7202]
MSSNYQPSFFLKSGLIQTIYIAKQLNKHWQKTINLSPISYREKIFYGVDNVPLYALTAIPPKPKGTIIATYGITGNLDNQWLLQILARKAYHLGYAIILFDWRAHGKTAQLSPVLTSDGIFEGQDFVAIASQAKKEGFPSKFWFTGYSLGGQLALWAISYGSQIDKISSLTEKDIGGCGVICPSLDAEKSLTYLENHPLKKYLDQAITQGLRALITHIHHHHPQDVELKLLPFVDSIRNFDQYFVIPTLGFKTVTDYYYASSPFRILPKIKKPTLIIYAKDDPMFCPTIIPDLEKEISQNHHLQLILTRHGGHVGYINSARGQKLNGDDDIWWAWNRFLDWLIQEDT